MSREAELAIQIVGALGMALKADVYKDTMIKDAKERAIELYKLLEDKN